MIIYKDLYDKVDFLKSKDKSFISWICPVLKTRVAAPVETIYYENDLLNVIYFMKKEQCNYVLPRYNNTTFLKIVEQTCFGLVDFAAAML